MTELIVDRLTASARSDDAPRVRRLMSALADARLDEALSAAVLPAGDWCVRRVDVTMSLDPDRTDAAVTAQWAQALVAALERRMAQGETAQQDADVVHYPRPADGLADLLAGAAVGRVDREWAWRRLGLLGPGDGSAAGSPRAAVLAAARRRPELALAGLLGAVGRIGVAALHRTLGAAGWAELASIVLAARGESVPHVDQPQADADPDRVAGIRARSRLAADFRRARGRLRVDRVTARAWAALVVAEAEPALAGRRDAAGVMAALAAGFATAPGGRAPTSPAGTGAEATTGEATTGEATTGEATTGEATTCEGARWRPRAVHDTELPPASGLLSDEPPSDPPPLRAGADRSLDPAHRDPAHLDPAATDREGTGRGDVCREATDRDDTDRDDADRDDADLGDAETDVVDRDGLGVDRVVDERAVRLPTAWAGLLFLLATAGRAGVPDDLLAHDALAGHPLGWALYHVGRLLVPAEQDDPALFAFAGVAPRTAAMPPDPEAVPGAPTALAGAAARWAAAAAQRLGAREADGDPLAVVARIAARDGAISTWPGWVEVHLPLDGVDIDVRRAGLDVDPGWVPWLGTVVVFRYE